MSAAQTGSEMSVPKQQPLRGIAAYSSSLLHAAAREDPVTAARQQSFIAVHLSAGLLALCVLPVYLLVSGRPSIAGAVALLWFLSPIGIVYFLSRTGRFGAAHLISATSFAGLIVCTAWLTGGIASFLIPWMVVVPLEAALSTERRTVIWAAAASCLGLLALAAGDAFGLTPPAPTPALPGPLLGVIGAVSAAIYAASLAIAVQRLQARSEEAIEASEERYRLLAENATDLITRHDEKGRVVFASHAAQQLLGVEPGKLLGDGLFDRVHIVDRPAYLTALSRCRAENEAVAVEFRVKRSSEAAEDDHVWVEMRCRPFQPDGARKKRGQGGGVLAGTRDISERKVHEAELLRTRDEARNASRAKSQFLANMSHEIRTPLNAVIGFSEILNRQLFGAMQEERYRDYARLIHESGEHLLNVVNDILDMSMIEAGKFKIAKEAVEASALVESCREIMRHTAEKKGVSLVVEVTPGLPEFIADKRACKQMLLNMISNAIKFTNAGGWVRVSVQLKDGIVSMSVADNGIGIPAQDLPKLGNPFVQADNSGGRSEEGTGLGLSVVKGLAKLHGGEFRIMSELGQGTIASVALPFDPPREEDLARRAESAA
jgi:two-component system, cell cycle sensor histidine kinase DivJ